MTVDIVLNGVSFGGKSALILQADFEERWWRDRSCPGWNSEQRSLNACHVHRRPWTDPKPCPHHGEDPAVSAGYSPAKTGAICWDGFKAVSLCSDGYMANEYGTTIVMPQMGV